MVGTEKFSNGFQSHIEIFNIVEKRTFFENETIVLEFKSSLVQSAIIIEILYAILINQKNAISTNVPDNNYYLPFWYC